MPRRLREGSLSPDLWKHAEVGTTGSNQEKIWLATGSHILSMCTMCVNVLHLPVYRAAFQPTLGIGLLNMFSPFIIPIIKTIHGLKLLPASHRSLGKNQDFSCSTLSWVIYRSQCNIWSAPYYKVFCFNVCGEAPSNRITPC